VILDVLDVFGGQTLFNVQLRGFVDLGRFLCGERPIGTTGILDFLSPATITTATANVSSIQLADQ
jgi:hypothetical protein